MISKPIAVRVRKVSPLMGAEIPMPAYATSGAAAMDLHACCEAPILIPAIFLGLEVLFGFVQALVFALLAMTYIATAIAEHHAAGHDDDHGEADAAHADHSTAAEAAHA